MQRSSISTFLKKETELSLKLHPRQGKYIAFRPRMTERRQPRSAHGSSVREPCELHSLLRPAHDWWSAFLMLQAARFASSNIFQIFTNTSRIVSATLTTIAL